MDEAREYTPSEEDRLLIGEVNEKYSRWRDERRPHEVQWFLNAAFYRGQHYVAWDNQFHTLRPTQPLNIPPHKKKIPINRIFPKIRTRLAKFLRARPQPIVLPASNERRDKMDARASQMALDYIWRRQRLEVKYRDALLWAKDCGVGLWWFHWKSDSLARVQLQNKKLGTKRVLNLPVGDIQVEVSSPFELLVADPTVSSLDDQPEIMRVKMRELEEVKVRFPEVAQFLTANSEGQDTFNFERRIAQLTSRAEGVTFGGTEETGTDKHGGNQNKVLVKELFTKPGGKFPKGRYVVVIGSVLGKKEQEIPWFSDMESAYPAVEFVDVPMVGQFWKTTVTEQLIGPQRQYNFIRNKIDQQLRLMMHPKIFYAIQSNLPANAFHSGAGEKIPYNWIPGLPPPFAWTPPNVAADAWRMIETLKEEIDDISQIFPSSEGSVGDAKSGFQTNLLQEASDSVHAPDARAHELAIESAAWKLRRLMKLGYDVPRLLTITGRHRRAEVLEFHSEQIDENADIIVQTGSGLPTLKAARQQVLLEYYKQGIYGPVGDPETNRKFLAAADVAGVEEFSETARVDEELAELENDEIVAGQDIPVPQFYEDHQQHYQIHTEQLKKPEVRDWPDELRLKLIAHTLLHFKYIDPISAANLAIEYGMADLIGFGVDKIPPPPPPMGALPGEPGAPEGMVPPAPAPPPLV